MHNKKINTFFMDEPFAYLKKITNRHLILKPQKLRRSLIFFGFVAYSFCDLLCSQFSSLSLLKFYSLKKTPEKRSEPRLTTASTTPGTESTNTSFLARVIAV